VSAPTLARPADTRTTPPHLCAWCNAPAQPTTGGPWCTVEHRSYDLGSETTWRRLAVTR
jgi:hypothetical protein